MASKRALMQTEGEVNHLLCEQAQEPTINLTTLLCYFLLSKSFQVSITMASHNLPTVVIDT